MQGSARQRNRSSRSSAGTRPGGREPSALREDYTARINRVTDYIDRHLTEDLSLTRLARVACCSPFHFHRMFREATGENLHHFVQRVRVELAGTMLLARPDTAVTEIAIECGFSSSAAFARVFRQRFHITANEWRAGGGGDCRKDVKLAAPGAPQEGAQQWGVVRQTFDETRRVAQWWIRCKKKPPALVEVRQMPPFHVAYIRHVGRYQGMADVFTRLFTRLMKWAGARGFLQDPNVKVLAVYHDNPAVTDDDRLRVSASVTLPNDTKASGAVSCMTVPGGLYAVARFQLNEKEYGDAWYAVVAGWVPESGYEFDNRFCYELYSCDGIGQCGGTTTVDICVPVRPH